MASPSGLIIQFKYNKKTNKQKKKTVLNLKKKETRTLSKNFADTIPGS